MPHPATRLVWCALFLLALPACDAGRPSDTDALIGSWSFREAASETYVTVNQAQPFFDPQRPTTGSVAFSGAETGTFQFLPLVPTADRAVLSTRDQRDGAHQATRAELSVGGGRATLSQRRSDGSLAVYSATVAASPFSYADGTLNLQALTLLDTGGSGAAVSVRAGMMVYQQLPLAAGASTRIVTTPSEFENQPGSALLATEIEFRAGGVFAAPLVQPSSGEVRPTEGTWSVAGGRLRLTVDLEGSLHTAAFDIAVDGDRLRLGVREDVCAGDDGCLRYAETTYGLRQGTLMELSGERASAFVRGG